MQHRNISGDRAYRGVDLRTRLLMAVTPMLVGALSLAGCGSHPAKPTAAPTTTGPGLTTTAPVATSTTAAATTTTASPPTTVTLVPTSPTAAPTTTTGAPTTTTGAPATSTTSASTTSPPAVTSTTGHNPNPTRPGSHFPIVVNQAMETFDPVPTGAEAPDVLPPAAAAVSAEATGLGGTDSVTLIATAVPEPVNSPEVAKAAVGGSAELGQFATIAATSAAAALGYVASQASLLIATCSGRPSVLTLSGRKATSCPSGQGPLVTFQDGQWEVQVQDLDGNTSPTATAAAIASWLAGHQFPAAGKGLASVTLPGDASAGPQVITELVWAAGHDDYQVSGRGDYLGVLQLATNMRPWPGS